MNTIRCLTVCGVLALIAGCGGGEGEKTIVLNPGDGLPTEFYTGMDVADLDGDGFLDLVAASSLNDGNRNFEFRISAFLQDELQPRSFTDAIRSPDSLSTGSTWTVNAIDLTSDGSHELVVKSVGQGGFRTFTRDPATPGGFLDAAHHGPVDDDPGSSFAEAMAVGDIDGDAFPDVALTAGDRVLMYPQDRSRPGSFLRALVVGEGTGAVSIADVDGDGLSDILTFRPKSGALQTVLYYRQNTSAPGTFRAPIELNFDFSGHDVSARHTDSDGRMDIIVSGGFGDDLDLFSTFSVFRQYSLNTFTETRGPNTGRDRLSAGHDVADLDGDGTPEIVVGQRTGARETNSIEIFRQVSGGRFERMHLLTIPFGEPNSTPEIFATRIADMDNDMQPDIAITTNEVLVFFQVTGQPGAFENPTVIAAQR